MNDAEIKKKFLPWMPEDKLALVEITERGLVYKNEILVASRTIQDLRDVSPVSIETTVIEDVVADVVVETPEPETEAEVVVSTPQPVLTPQPKKTYKKR